MFSLTALLLVLLLAVLATLTTLPQQTTAAIAAHRVASIPGFPPLRSTWYAGMLPVACRDGKKRSFFYTLVEAEAEVNDPTTAPLITEQDGGPGCSSTYQLFAEGMGPTSMSRGGSWAKNMRSWTQFASVLFFDAPPGVGFSRDNSSNPQGTVWNDDLVADTNWRFLLAWLQQYPEYRGRPTFASGISYFGRYGPQLLWKIVSHGKAFPFPGLEEDQQHNAKLGSEFDSVADDLKQQMRGIMVGSGCLGTDKTSGPLQYLDYCFTTHPTDPGVPLFLQTHGLNPSAAMAANAGVQSDPRLRQLIDPWWQGNVPGFDVYAPLERQCMLDDDPNADDKKKGIDEQEAESGAAAAAATPLVFRPYASRRRRSLAVAASLDRQQRRSADTLGESSNTIIGSGSNYTPQKISSLPLNTQYAATYRSPLPEYEPCASDMIVFFANNLAVQKALHVVDASATVPVRFLDCADSNNFSYPVANTSYGTRRIYEVLLDPAGEYSNLNLHYLLFNGDNDLSVNHLQTEMALSVMANKGAPLAPMKPFYYSDPYVGDAWRQIGGWYVEFANNISWAVIKASGHMASQSMSGRPAVYQLVKSFVETGRPGAKPKLNKPAANIFAQYGAVYVASDSAAWFNGPSFGIGFAVGIAVLLICYGALLLLARMTAVTSRATKEEDTTQQPLSPSEGGSTKASGVRRSAYDTTVEENERIMV